MIDTRLVQVFLSPAMSPGPGIYEVSSDEDANLYCTCPGFSGRSVCKHTKFVQARVENNKGSYPLELSSKATEEDARRARESSEEFRKFVIKYGKIEVF